MSLAVPATAHRCGRSRASHSASSGHLSEDGSVSPPFPAATALLCAPIVLFSIHIVSYPYFCTNAHFVQYLFFKHALMYTPVSAATPRTALPSAGSYSSAPFVCRFGYLSTVLFSFHDPLSGIFHTLLGSLAFFLTSAAILH